VSLVCMLDSLAAATQSVGVRGRYVRRRGASWSMTSVVGFGRSAHSPTVRRLWAGSVVPSQSSNRSPEPPIFGCDVASKPCVSPPRHCWLKSVQGESLLLFVGVAYVVSRVMLRLYWVATLALYRPS
jgi:hypothetical protein